MRSRHFWLLIVLTGLLVVGSGKHFNSSVPPRGWNSYDAYSWIISEEEFLQNAQNVSKLMLEHGYEYVVVDYLWYRRKIDGAYSNSLGYDVIDEWGRPIPDPERFPSSKEGNGFKNLADTVHKMGLKFGIHVMRGISTQAVNSNPLILDISKGGAYNESGRLWRAADIGVKERPCPWMSNGFMSVNTNLSAGRAFLKSLYHQYAEWGVDLVKHDCIFGDDLDINERQVVSEAISEATHPILYSLSPGVNVTPKMVLKVISNNGVNMYRVTGDDWDRWEHVAAHFNVARDFARAGMIGFGGTGPFGSSWPDMDMLPLGWLTDPGSNEGPHRKSGLTLDEQWTQMTLWSMAKSPLIFGGDMRKIDLLTLSILTNPTLLEINAYSSKNMEYPSITSTKGGEVRAWVALGRSKGEIYVSFFNLSSHNTTISTTIPDLAKALPEQVSSIQICNCFQGYTREPLGTTNHMISREVVPHGAALFILNCW